MPTGRLPAPVSITACAEGEFLHRGLSSQTGSQMQAEARGRVMIREGLEDAGIERAFDEHFDRVAHLMFVRTRQPQCVSGYRAEDDGCD